eukprot:c19988_g5_i1.p1 GENE.c19988_g5_i1~~c19988_g5_i1.p1  ORF type:complete len:337 (+),score=69.34 c19988_g5_i1:634-1644(+)
MGASFPANNTLRIRPVLVTILRILMSPWLVFSGEWLIPRLSRLFTAWYTAVTIKYQRKSSTVPAEMELQDTLMGQQQKSSDAELLTDRLKHPRWVKMTAQLILASQLVVLALAPIASQIMIGDKCFGLARVFWEPCRGETSLFDVNINISNPLVPPVPVLTRSEVCDVTGKIVSEVCVRAIIASVSALNVSKVLVQTLFVLLRALLAILLIHYKIHKRKDRIGTLAHMIAEPQEDSVTRSILSLVLLGFVFGGVAPLIWPVVLLGVYATKLMWRCTQQRATQRLKYLVASRVMKISLLVQLGMAICSKFRKGCRSSWYEEISVVSFRPSSDSGNPD